MLLIWVFPKAVFVLATKPRIDVLHVKMRLGGKDNSHRQDLHARRFRYYSKNNDTIPCTLTLFLMQNYKICTT